MTYTVLFVCAGNIGRSPLAEAMARRFLAETLGIDDGELGKHGIRVLSAGTGAPEEIQTSVRGMELASEIGITMKRRPAQLLTKQLAGAANVIYGMDLEQLQYLAAWGFGDKTSLLDSEGKEILDPRHRDMIFFRRIRDQIAVALQGRVPQILTEAADVR